MDKGALDRLEVRVSQKGESAPIARRPLQWEAEQTPHDWGPAGAKRPSFIPRFSALELIFTVSIIFFVGATTVAGLLIFSGSNTVSTRNVEVTVAGPNSIRAGEEVTLQVVITNKNAAPMNLTDLLIEYPPGTRSPVDVSLDLPRSRESLGTIEPGASVNRSVKAVLFGTVGIPAEVMVTAEYRVPGSNAVFQSSNMYRTIISQSPASITVDSLSEVLSGQSTEFTITVVSNASEVLTDMLLVAAYPPGFSFESSTPKPVSGSAVWDIGNIEPNGKRTVKVRGTFAGEDGDDRVIHFTTGTKKKQEQTAIAAPLASVDTTIRVAKPFVSVQVVLNSATTEVVSADRGAIVRGEVRWANNLPVRVQNVEIRVKLAGAILDRNSVRVGNGFFRSSDNTIIFSKAQNARLADVEPGATGTSIFEFATLPKSTGAFQSPEVTLDATVTGNRSSEGGVISVVESSAKARLLVATDLTLTAGLTHVAGPKPPKIDVETTYTVSWVLQNSANAIANTVVTGILPSYVLWKGASGTGISYNENGRTVTWTVGDLTANATASTNFTVSVTPSIPQANNVVVLVADTRVSAFDRFIRSTLERVAAPITTESGLTRVEGVVVP